MADIHLIKYSVKGIKAIDQLVSLSFYKKIIPKNADTQAYNIKGIYGMNGSGKWIKTISLLNVCIRETPPAWTISKVRGTG